MTVEQQRTWREWVMGGVAPTHKLRLLLRVSAVVLTLDVLSKVLVVLLLDEGVDHWVGQALSLRLEFNESGVGSRAERNVQQFGSAPVFLHGAGLLLGMFVPLVFSRPEHPPPWKAASLIGVPFVTLIVAIIAGFIMSVAMPDASVSLDAIRAVQIVTALTFWGLCMRLTRNKYLFVAASMQLSAGLGNACNPVVEPRGVVDFIWVPAFSPHLGVFNLADAAIELSIGMLLAYPLVAAFGYAPGFAATWSKLVWHVDVDDRG